MYPIVKLIRQYNMIHASALSIKCTTLFAPICSFYSLSILYLIASNLRVEMLDVAGSNPVPLQASDTFTKWLLIELEQA